MLVCLRGAGALLACPQPDRCRPGPCGTLLEKKTEKRKVNRSGSRLDAGGCMASLALRAGPLARRERRVPQRSYKEQRKLNFAGLSSFNLKMFSLRYNVVA